MSSFSDAQENRELLRRRYFMKSLGAGALGAAALGQGWVTNAQEKPALDPYSDDEDDVFPAACSKSLLSTERRADGQIVNDSCVDCDCPPMGQLNKYLKQTIITKFNAVSTICDRLFQIGFPVQATCEWKLKRHMLTNPICGPPMSSFAGKFTVRSLAGADLIKGKVVGTVGFDPCLRENTCCQSGRVMGTLAGKGVAGTPFAGCVAQWVFCGIEQSDLCAAGIFDVTVCGFLKCAC